MAYSRRRYICSLYSMLNYLAYFSPSGGIIKQSKRFNPGVLISEKFQGNMIMGGGNISWDGKQKMFGVRSPGSKQLTEEENEDLEERG